MKAKTHVAIVLDKSGSMESTKASTIKGFNEQVQQLKENAKSGQDILVSLVTFNGEVFEHAWDVPAEQMQEITENDYKPNGSTAMRDAVGYTVKKLLSSTDQNEENTAYLVIVISDGETNSDVHFKPAALKEMIEGCQNSKKWTFTYMGCSKSYLEEIARQTSVPISNMSVWDNTTQVATLSCMRAAATRSASYFAERAYGQTATTNYMSDVNEVADLTVEQPEEKK